jgi:hypothetical protein
VRKLAMTLALLPLVAVASGVLTMAFDRSFYEMTASATIVVQETAPAVTTIAAQETPAPTFATVAVQEPPAATTTVQETQALAAPPPVAATATAQETPSPAAATAASQEKPAPAPTTAVQETPAPAAATITVQEAPAPATATPASQEMPAPIAPTIAVQETPAPIAASVAAQETPASVSVDDIKLSVTSKPANDGAPPSAGVGHKVDSPAARASTPALAEKPTAKRVVAPQQPTATRAKTSVASAPVGTPAASARGPHSSYGTGF